MRVTGALVTHYHQDHVGGEIFGMNIEGLTRLLARAPVPIYANEHEAAGAAARDGDLGLGRDARSEPAT